jgi:hypothetical protein
LKTSSICEAIKKRRRLEIQYHGQTRVLEAHIVGRSREGNWLMRGWQVRGGSNSGAPVGWKLIRLDELQSVIVLDETSLAPRSDYNPRDPAMLGGILCRV